jgi:hypothetical protein
MYVIFEINPFSIPFWKEQWNQMKTYEEKLNNLTAHA